MLPAFPTGGQSSQAKLAECYYHHMSPYKKWAERSRTQSEKHAATELRALLVALVTQKNSVMAPVLPRRRRRKSLEGAHPAMS